MEGATPAHRHVGLAQNTRAGREAHETTSPASSAHDYHRLACSCLSKVRAYHRRLQHYTPTTKQDYYRRVLNRYPPLSIPRCHLRTSTKPSTSPIHAHTPRMATVDERELQINPIVATSVQHNTQVHPPSPPPPFPIIHQQPKLTHLGHIQHPQPHRLSLRRRRRHTGSRILPGLHLLPDRELRCERAAVCVESGGPAGKILL